MAETNCTDVLINPPKLVDKAQLNLDVLEKLKKSTAFSLFGKVGVPASKLLGVKCFSKSGLAEVKPPNPLLQKLRVGVACKNGGVLASIGCTF